jgi:antibiotic biosynthesis monooxygenase (ABM) superfamily enzyme
MRKQIRTSLLLAAVVFVASWVSSQETGTTQKTVVHTAIWTLKEGSSAQEYEAFRKETEKLVAAMPGLKRAWVGKLRQPLAVGEVTRTHGLLLEFVDVQSREAYSTHPARAAWAEAWSKVRVPGSTAFDLIGD